MTSNKTVIELIDRNGELHEFTSVRKAAIALDIDYTALRVAKARKLKSIKGYKLSFK